MKKHAITSPIDLHTVCTSHEDVRDSIQKSFFEELFAVCTNEDFLKTITKTRLFLWQKFGVQLPTSNKEIVRELRVAIYEQKQWSLYRQLLKDIGDRHGLVGNPYHTTIRKLSPDGRSFAKHLDEMLNPIIDLSILERIIYYNDPLLEYDIEKIDELISGRGGYLQIAYDDNAIPAGMEAYFFLNSTKADIKRVVDQCYDYIAKERDEYLNTVPKKDVRKENLPLKFRTYQLAREGKSVAAIANTLVNEGFGKNMNDGLGASIDFEHIRKILLRMKDDSKRFDARVGTR
jgi:hypothetical protein